MAPAQTTRLTGDGDFQIDVRGESHYQHALEQICKGRSSDNEPVSTIAQLIPELTNKADRNAVRVDINGSTVGYLSRDIAPVFRRAIATRGLKGSIECPAIIRGGFKRGREIYPYGVRLDLPEDMLDELAHTTVDAKPRKKAGGCLKWIGIAVGVFIMLAIIGAIVRPDDEAAAEGVIPVPTFTSTPAVVESTRILEVQSADDYRASMINHSRELSEGIQSIGTLMQDPKLTEQSWIIDMGVAIARIELAHEELIKLEPSADLTDFHRQLTGAAETCSVFAQTLSFSIDERSESGLGTSIEMLNKCSTELKAAAELVQ